MICTYSIGIFAKKCNTTITELRFYDQKGILPADEVSATGRRFYSDASYEKYMKIQRFQEAGFSLAEIQAHFNESDHLTNASLFEKKRKELQQKLLLLDELENENALEQIRPKKRYTSPITHKVDVEIPSQVATLIDVLNQNKSSDQ